MSSKIAYTGVTTLNGGTVTAGKATAFGAAGATSGTIINASVTLNTNSQNFGDERFTVKARTPTPMRSWS